MGALRDRGTACLGRLHADLTLARITPSSSSTAEPSFASPASWGSAEMERSGDVVAQLGRPGPAGQALWDLLSSLLSPLSPTEIDDPCNRLDD